MTVKTYIEIQQGICFGVLYVPEKLLNIVSFEPTSSSMTLYPRMGQFNFSEVIKKTLTVPAVYSVYYHCLKGLTSP